MPYQLSARELHVNVYIRKELAKRTRMYWFDGRFERSSAVQTERATTTAVSTRKIRSIAKSRKILPMSKTLMFVVTAMKL